MPIGAPQRQVQPVSPDLLTRPFTSMLPTPEREVRAVGSRVPQSDDYVMVHGLGLVRAMHAPVVPGMRPSAVHRTRTTASAQQLQMQQLQMQMQSQQMQNQQILQALQHLLLSNAHQQPSGAHAAVLEGLAAQQQQCCLQLTSTSMPSTASQVQALVLDDQPSSSAAPIRRREIPLLKSLTSMQQFWQLWHQGAPLSGIGAVKALPADEKHKVRQRFSEWKKAVKAIEERAQAASRKRPPQGIHSVINNLEQERLNNKESVATMVIRLGPPTQPKANGAVRKPRRKERDSSKGK